MSSDLKLSAMMLLIADGRKVSRTAMNKLLFFCDAVHFLKEGKTISGRIYTKKQFGPVPELVDADRNKLMAWKYLSEDVSISYTNYQYDYSTNLDAVDMSQVLGEFEASEKRTVDDVVGCLAKFSPTALSEKSHEFEPWKSARPNSNLDMEKVKDDVKFKAWLQEVGIEINNVA